MQEPKISVYIPSRNYGKYLGDAIESVLRQTFDDWELLVIDDASTDETPAVIQLYKAHPRIRTYRREGIGLPAVCNLALREARGEHIVRLDGDDVFDENVLLVLGHHLDTNPEVALVFPDYYLIDEHGDILGCERRGKVYSENHVLDAPSNGACTLVRCSVLREVGGYREDLGAQDGFDLWSKITERYKIANVNLPLFYYRRHGNNLTNDHRRILQARRQIKRDAIANDLERVRPIVAAIPCRRNYDFCEDLWQQPFNGRSLLQRDIEMCLSSTLFDHVVVACDNPAAEKEAAAFDDPRLRFVLRHPKETLRSRSLAPTLERCVRPLDPELRGITVVSYIQTPFVTKDTLEEAVFTLVMNQADGACGVEEVKDHIYRRTAHGLSCLNPKRELSTDFDAIYREVSTALATRSRNLPCGSLTGSTVVHYVISSDEGIFVNSDRMLEVARVIDSRERRRALETGLRHAV